MFADTVEVMLPSEFDEPAPFAFQFHDAYVCPEPFTPPSVLTVNPSLSKDVSKAVDVASAFEVEVCIILLLPLIASNKLWF